MLDKTFVQTEEEPARLCGAAGLLRVIIAAESRGTECGEALKISQ